MLSSGYFPGHILQAMQNIMHIRIDGIPLGSCNPSKRQYYTHWHV